MTDDFNVVESALSGRYVIEASAGTGKTWTLTRMVLRLVVEKGIPLPRILLVTFTRVATAEMRDRIHRLLADALHAWRHGQMTDEWTPLFTRWRQLDEAAEVESRLVDALESFDQASIYTIHGFCHRMLTEGAFCGATMVDRMIMPADALIELTTHEFLRRELQQLPPLDLVTERAVRIRLVSGAWQTLLKRFAARSMDSREKVVPRTGEGAVGQVMADIIDRWKTEGVKSLRAKQKEVGLMTEDDLLTAMDESLKVLDFRKWATDRFDAVLIDEFQDTNDIQYRIFRTLFWAGFSKKFVLLVGDPKQAIYRFRAADPMIYTEAVKEIGHREKLLTNYRSHPALVTGINTFFTQAKQPFLSRQVKFEPGIGGKAMSALLRQGRELPVFEVWRAEVNSQDNADDARKKEALCTAQEIVELLDGKTRIDGRILRPSDIAILVPRWSDADLVWSELTESGVPVNTLGKMNLCTTAAATDLLTLLEAVQSPQDAERLEAAQVTPLLGRTLSEAVSDTNTRTADANFLRSVGQAFDKAGMAGVLASFFNDPVRWWGIRSRDGLNYLSDFRELCLHLHERYGQTVALLAVIRWLRRNVNQLSEESMVIASADDNAVTIQTLHGSKGMEYPVVYLLGTTRSRIEKSACVIHCHDEVKNELWVSDRKPELQPKEFAWASEAAASEKARLLYVGMTRAKNRLVLPLFYGQKNPSVPVPFQVLAGQLKVKKADYESLLDKLAERLSDIPGQPCQVVRKSLNETTAEVPQEQSVSTAVAASVPLLACRHTSSFSSLIRRRLTTQEENQSIEFPEKENIVIHEKAPAMVGAQVGLFLHEVMEHLDFAEPLTNGTVIVEAMEHYPSLFDSEDTVRDWQRFVETMAERVAEMPLTENLKLKEVDRWRRQSEWPFTLAIGRKGVSVRASALMQLLRSFGDRYDVGEITDTALEGYLTGTADLVFEHEGRFYLVDWKSNLIGHGTSEDYTESAMEDEMQRHGYRLQYLLYLVALTRFVASRGGTSFAEAYEKIGGVFYVFLRGINRDGTRGVVRERPPVEMMTALDAFFKAAGNN